MIALRYNLLGGGLNPAAVLWFYELRSRIVHGSQLGVAYSLDIWKLRLISYEVLDGLIRQAQQMPEVTTLEDLISTLMTAEKLQEFVRRCQMGIYEGRGNNKIL